MLKEPSHQVINKPTRPYVTVSRTDQRCDSCWKVNDRDYVFSNRKCLWWVRTYCVANVPEEYFLSRVEYGIKVGHFELQVETNAPFLSAILSDNIVLYVPFSSVQRSLLVYIFLSNICLLRLFRGCCSRMYLNTCLRYKYSQATLKEAW
mgnify:CR=1 FL=1